MNLELSVKNYLDAISSSSPTPGGGNVSAFCGVLASSLGEMVCNLTIGKKKYLEVEEEIIDLKEKLILLKSKFLELAQEDNDAFDAVMATFKLPKDSEEAIKIRQSAIESATKQAIKVPFEVIDSCNYLIQYLLPIAEKGNKNSITDAGVAILLSQTAAKGAYLNVLINCATLKDREFVKITLSSAEQTIDKINIQAEQIFQTIKNGMINE